MNKPTQEGYEYFITFTDDYSKSRYMNLMWRKSESFEKFKEFKDEAEWKLYKHIKALQFDWGG